MPSQEDRFKHRDTEGTEKKTFYPKNGSWNNTEQQSNRKIKFFL